MFNKYDTLACDCCAAQALYFSVQGEWLIDYIWVQDLTAPMHLGLIDGPFVPHIKIKGAL